MSQDIPKSGEFQDLKLWFERKASIVTIGLTHLAADELGEVDQVELLDEGTEVVKGDILCTVDGTHGKIEVISPANGIVESINETAKEEPSIVSEDPLEEGWLFKLQVEDLSEFKESIS